jgi:hypothetical protein
MKKRIRTKLLLIGILLINIPVMAQNKLPEIMTTGTMDEQLDYLHQKTLIYNDFRAIREDIFQKLRSNTVDTLNSLRNEISNRDKQITAMAATQDSVQDVLNGTRIELTQAIENRDSLFIFGIPLNKAFYNSLMWTIILGMFIITALALIAFRRNLSVTKQTSKEYKDVRDEFEEYRKSNREKMEKMVIEHFNEIKKIKGER